MEIQTLEILVGTVGFPIAASAALFWLYRDTVKRYEKLLNEFRNTLERNTEAVNKLSAKLKD